MTDADLYTRTEASATRTPVEDPLTFISDALTKLKTEWMRLTYPFGKFGKNVSIHYSCELRRSMSPNIHIGNSVYIGPGAWLNVPEPKADGTPILVLGDGSKIGRRCMFSCKNSVCFERDVMLGPSVLITDHSHAYSDFQAPIHSQGLTEGGTVRIEANCWIGHGAAIICTSGHLVIGRNCVIGANSVVTSSIPPFSVALGNPARIIRRYGPAAE